MRNRLLLLLVVFLTVCNSAFAQLVAGNAYLQGAWLEIGMGPNGSLGPCSSPVGYHPHNGGTTWTTGAALAEVYDYGHDGWSVGAPAFMGDYTFPGSPFEGWEIQCNGARAQAYETTGGCSTGYTFAGGGTMTGAVTTYSNTGGRILGNWAGTTSGGNLAINMETRVDTFASAVVMTVVFHNTGATAIPAVYYWRSADPDNDETWAGGSFFTDNTVIYQNDVDHRVMVTAVGTSATHPPLSLATKDCRAVACIYNDWGLTVGQDLAAVWNQTYAPAEYTPGVADNGDIAIGLVYNIGTIGIGDSAIISYAYVFNGTAGIDSAFPDPELVINHVPVTIYPDTFDACAFPTLDSVPLTIMYGSDKDWSWSKWTWTPSTGLSATTGTNVFANLTEIPGDVTYTVTGVDTAVGEMLDCGARVFVFTLKSCHSARNNSPCQGDALIFGMSGDSTGATYFWWGPGGFTSTLHDPVIYPATLTDSGLYYVVKTIAGVSDTDSTHVIIHPKPILNVVNNGPLCSGLLDTLLLGVSPDSVGETFSWTGPDGFSSTLEFPVVDSFTAVNAGIYTVVGVSSFGCKDTASTTVSIVPPPVAPGITGTIAYCEGGAFVPFVVSSISGSTVLWYYPTSTTPGTLTAPTVNTSVPGTYTYYATQTFGCISPMDSITVVVYPAIVPDFTWQIYLGCLGDSVVFTNTSLNASHYSWNFGDGTIDTSTNPTHVFSVSSVQRVTLTAYNSLCSAPDPQSISTVHNLHAGFNLVPDTICAGQATVVNDSFTVINNTSTANEPSGSVPVAAFAWSFGDGTTDNTSAPPHHSYATGGVYPVKLTITDSIGCMDSTSENLYVLQLHTTSFNDTMICISEPLVLTNTTTMNPDLGLTDYSYSWNPTTNLTDGSVQIPNFYGFGVTTYTLTTTINPYGCYSLDTIRINSVLGTVLGDVTASATIPYGSSIQLNADSEVIYRWVPNDGSLDNPNINDPIATPLVTTVYTVFGYDVNGCLDSATVTITVDSTMEEDMPSGFTPNNDGLNDVFRPVGLKFQRMLEMRVYNRWGQQVFYSNNYKIGWDGTWNGVPQDMGVYYYVIVVGKPGGDGTNVTYKGDVTLIR